MSRASPLNINVSHQPMRTIAARVLLVSLIAVSIIPLLLGLGASFLMIGAGISQALNESMSKGLIFSLAATFAFCGVFTLSNLCIHYLKTPFLNPSAVAAKKYGAGLVLGWVSVLLMWFGAIGKNPEIGVGVVLLMPCAVVISLWWLVNAFCSSAHG